MCTLPALTIFLVVRTYILERFSAALSYHSENILWTCMVIAIPIIVAVMYLKYSNVDYITTPGRGKIVPRK